MRTLPPALADHLASGVTTLCTCWRLTRHDGATLCFTDHDRDLTFEGSLFEASAGLMGSASEGALGLSGTGSEVSGVLTSARISEADLSEGDYDGARVEIWRVNWQEPLQCLLLDVHVIGEVKRSASAFTAELRPFAPQFDQESGRLYQTQCDADLGDARCGVDLNLAAFRVVTQVAAAVGDISFDITAPVVTGFFDSGRVQFVSGANAGLMRSVESCTPLGTGARVRLWQRLPVACATGDQLVLRAGCDKSFATCRTKFANAQRFRGFPHMPGTEAPLLRIESGTTKMDGGSLYA